MKIDDSQFWKTARIKSGLSQYEVAKSLNYTSSQVVSNWERGLCAPPEKTLKKLLELYAIDIEDFIQACLEKEKARLKDVFEIKQCS